MALSFPTFKNDWFLYSANWYKVIFKGKKTQGTECFSMLPCEEERGENKNINTYLLFSTSKNKHNPETNENGGWAELRGQERKWDFSEYTFYTWEMFYISKNKTGEKKTL